MDNFIVSARKYRPATFESVVGQGHITSTLKNAIARGQLAHAYLFCGPRGVGKTTCARIFAKTINCQNPTATGDACGECESCRSFNEGRSFSIHELDAASNNSVENIRDLTDQVRVPPQVGKYSVYIIDEVHMLSQAAFNAFLKTLEEPPHHAIFILATTEKHKIIPTILSRCQIYDFQRIRIEDTVSYLKYIASQESVQTDDESLHLIAAKADGGMRDALSMFDKAVSFCGGKLSFREVAETLNVLDYDTYFSITEQMLAGDYKSALVTFDNVLKKGFSGQTFMAGLASHFRDLMMCKDPQTLPLLEVTGAVLERYKQQCASCSVPFLFGAISLLGTLDSGFRTATNQRLHVELGLMKLCGLEQKKSPDVSTTPLPQLVKSQPQTPTTPQPTAQVAQTTPPTPTEQATHVATTPSKVEPVAEPVMQVAPTPKATSKATTATIFGGSLGAVLSGKGYGNDEEEASTTHHDPRSQEKILAHREEFLTELERQSPRMAYALKDMVVSGHTISTTVVTEMVKEELLRGRGEINTLLERICGLDGVVELDVVVSKSEANNRPVRSEDKFKFLSERNEELGTLIKELDMDYE